MARCPPQQVMCRLSIFFKKKTLLFTHLKEKKQSEAHAYEHGLKAQTLKLFLTKA